MSVHLNRELLRNDEFSKQEKFAVMQKRRARLTQIGKDAIEAQGYKLGGSLKVPGSHAVLAERDGEHIRVGIKTCADRWMSVARDRSGGFGLLDKVDELFVVTFDAWPEPGAVQVLKFDPGVVTQIAKGVYAKADAAGHKGLQFLPLDEDTSRRPTTTKDASNLADHGEMVIEETIVWDDNDVDTDVGVLAADEIEEIEAEVEATETPELPLMDRIKIMLAEHIGVPADKIEIEIKFKS